MRYIAKLEDSSAAKLIEKFVETRLDARVRGAGWEEQPINYDHLSKSEILAELIKEQKGLCAYTGVGIDGRLSAYRPSNQTPPRDDYWYVAHVEHLKPQSQCKKELEAGGGIVGRDRGEDVDYNNLVAAIGVNQKRQKNVKRRRDGKPPELFGATYRGNEPLQILPTQINCEEAFTYLEDGGILPRGLAAKTTIETLALDHYTLKSWRKGAVSAFLSDDVRREDLEKIVDWVENKSTDSLPEFSFVIGQVAHFYLAKLDSSS